MALQTEIWINDIIEGLFADNSFLSRSVDHSDYVKERVVHVPNAGKSRGVKKNRSSYPAVVEQREDIDLTYMIDEYTTDPVHITDKDKVELSYDKRQSVIRQDKSELHEEVAKGILENWVPKKEAGQMNLIGSKFTRQDLSAIRKKFNKEGVPQKGRCVLLDPDSEGDLLDSLTESQAQAYHSAVDVERGVVGKILGFEILTPRPMPTGVKALAWHPNSLSRAMGDVKAFDNSNDATYYGDVLSFLLRAGGSIIRDDAKGVLALKSAGDSLGNSGESIDATGGSDSEDIGL
ncbi:hypothetical protein QYZ87_07865 [Porphyromonadaceae bacterium W3.11]|nr:hypothetical protein [Porphyromonadaceae bacterium W3.11]